MEESDPDQPVGKQERFSMAECSKRKSKGSLQDPNRLKVSRLFKKSSPNGQLTLFMPKRDLLMKGANGEVDPIEGVVLVSQKLANREM